uniref:Uncharacterized protein n=1 Tax=Candidatus Kentrum sp. FM TaxID=2126340 RepID=A0A450SW31_9GAMM|nr:MAG: hypothetical protein BECKFM1743C_GA0114222_102195 [Candidatus Kentron sp. FM]
MRFFFSFSAPLRLSVLCAVFGKRGLNRRGAETRRRKFNIFFVFFRAFRGQKSVDKSFEFGAESFTLCGRSDWKRERREIYHAHD